MSCRPFSDYIIVVCLMLLAVGLFMYMESKETCTGDTTTVETFVNKNNIGTNTRFELGIIQGGGGAPFVY